MRWGQLVVAVSLGCTPSGGEPRVAPDPGVEGEVAERAAAEREGDSGPQGRAAAIPAERTAYEGILDMDRVPGGKRFQGTWLRRDDGTRLLLAYRPMPEHFNLIERRVVVRGEHYSPQGQAIMAEHFRPAAIELAKGEPPPGAPPKEIPLPPRSRTGDELRARVGGWAEVHATLVDARPASHGDDWREVLFRMDDGTEFVTIEAEWVVDKTYRPHFGARVTVLGSVYEEEGALGFGKMVMCLGEVEGCGRGAAPVRR